jgi:hypothetical protein
MAFVKETLDDGTIYEGDKENGKHPVMGKLTYKDGSVYEGEIYHGKPNQHGKMTYANGDVYEGAFLAYGKPNGTGKMTYADGTVYEGHFKDGKPGKDLSWAEPPPPFGGPELPIDGDSEEW